jgi:hypothetical protein
MKISFQDFSESLVTLKVLGSFRYRKSANVLGVPISKSLNRNFMINQQIANPQIFTKLSTSQSQNSPIFVSENVFIYTIKSDHNMLYL